MRSAMFFLAAVFIGCGESKTVCVAGGKDGASLLDTIEHAEEVLDRACEEAYGPDWTHSSGRCYWIEYKSESLPEIEACEWGV